MEGHMITSRKLAEIRRSIHLYRRTSSINIDNSNFILREIIQQELKEGNIILCGRRSVWLHLRQLGIVASE